MSCHGDIYEFKRDCGVSSVMVARAAEWNPSVFRKKGKLNVHDVIKEYLKYVGYFRFDFQFNFLFARSKILVAVSRMRLRLSSYIAGNDAKKNCGPPETRRGIAKEGIVLPQAWNKINSL